MKMLKVSRKLHRWLMLFLGLQFLIWSISGAYMVIFDIDYIHGDSLVVNHQAKVNVDEITYPLSALAKQYPDAKNQFQPLLLVLFDRCHTLDHQI